MATPANANVVFLPWVRQGAASAIKTADTLGSNMRGAVDLTATLTINTTQSVPVPVRLRGPADVVGIDPHEIVRRDPKPNTTDFEPNYVPGIEFDRPDFPWLFTPAGTSDQKLTPWICLAVVRKQDDVVFEDPDPKQPLPAMVFKGSARPLDELPPLEEIWAWAHTHVLWARDPAAGAPTRPANSRPGTGLLPPRPRSAPPR